MNKVNLKIIVDALDEAFDGWMQFLNVETGEVVSFPEDRDFYEGDDYDADMEAIDANKLLKRLPDQYEIDEYSIMEDFAEEVQEPELMAALQRHHPFRRFKDTIYELGIEDKYYAFREDAFYEIAKEWCLDYGVPYFYPEDRVPSKMLKAFAILPESEDHTMEVIRCFEENGISFMVNLTDRKNEICVYIEHAEESERVLKDNGFDFTTRDYDMFSIKKEK